MFKQEIRTAVERREEEQLHPRATLSSRSRGRKREEEPCPIRTIFQRDRDRIIHSKSFRRLKHKTQVFLSPMDDHYRTRLTHTLEVAQIARTISRALRLNEDLTEAIALAHDLGHTPFGHSGEAALKEIVSGGFNHTEQSLRVVDILERGGKGLNLSWEVRDGIMRHSKGMKSIREFSREKLPSTLEGQVMRLSDIIAYINHDIDDAIRAGLIQQEDLPSGAVAVLGDTHSIRIDTIVKDVVESTLRIDLEKVEISSEIMEAMDILKSFLNDKVYNHLYNREEFQKGMRIVKSLYEFFMNNSLELDKYYDIRPEDPYERRVIDLIAGMTDRYAIQVFKDIFIPFS